MADLHKINCSDIKLGMRFSMPVYFDDGKYMFLAKRRSVKKYHLNAITRWDLPFLLTEGTVVEDNGEQLEKGFATFAKANYDNPSEVESIDDIDELEPLEELEEIE